MSAGHRGRQAGRLVVKVLCLAYLAVSLDPIAESEAIGTHPDEGEQEAMPSPAYRFCLDAGYRIEPITKNGIRVDADCVNPQNGRRCGVWPFLRGECRLDSPLR